MIPKIMILMLINKIKDNYNYKDYNYNNYNKFKTLKNITHLFLYKHINKFKIDSNYIKNNLIYNQIIYQITTNQHKLASREIIYSLKVFSILNNNYYTQLILNSILKILPILQMFKIL